MRGYDELLPSIQMVIACNTDPVMIEACRSSAREFFDRSMVWREDTQFIKEREGRSHYPLALPADTELLGVLTVLRGTKPLDPIGRMELAETEGRSGTPSGFYRDNLDIYLNFAPTKTSQIQPVLQLKPSIDSVGIDSDYMADKYRDYIVAGAVGRLAAMPAKMWSAPSVAAYYLGKFEDGVQLASREARRYTDGRPNQIEYPYGVREFASHNRRGSRGRY